MTHAQNIARLTAAEDWPALLRYWIAWQQKPALTAACGIVERRRTWDDKPWASLADFLSLVEQEPMHPRQPEAWMGAFVDEADPAAVTSLQCVLFQPIAVLCEVAQIAPLEEQANLFQHGVETALQGAGFAQQLGDVSLTAFFVELAISGCRNGGLREQAAELSAEALQLRSAAREADPSDEILLSSFSGALNNHSLMLSEIGRRDEALAPAEEAVRHFRALAQVNPAAYLQKLAASLNNWATRLIQAGRRSETLAPAEEAVRTFRALAEANPVAYLPDLAASLNDWANRLSEAGRKDKALAPAEEALRHYCTLAEANPTAYLPYLAGALNNWANRLSEAGRSDEALRAYREAGEKMEAVGKRLPRAVAPEAMKVHLCMAMHLRTEDTQLGWPDYIRAQEALRAARRWAGIYRRSWRAAERRQEVLRESLDLYDLSVRNAVDILDTSEDAALRTTALADALAAAEESRAQSLAERLLEEDLEPRNAPPGMAEEFRTARRRLRAAMANWERETGGAWSGPESPGAAGARLSHPAPMAEASSAPAPCGPEAEPASMRAARAEAEAAQAHHDALLAALQRHDPDYSPDGVPPVASVEAIRAALPPGSVALSFVLMNEETIVLLTGAGRIEAVRVPTFPYREAAQWARDWLLSYFSRPDRLPGETGEAWQARATQHLADWQGRIPERLAALEEKLLPPVVARLEQMAREGVRVERLVICPHIHLHLVPWAACRAGGQYLADRWEISTVPSLSMLVRCRKRPRPAGHALHVVNPTADLAFADAEHAALRRHYPQSRTLHRGEATREAVLAAAPEAWFFYYTGHMTFHPGEPLRGTAAVLAQGTRPATAGKSALREAPGTDERGKFLAPSHWLTLADVFAHMNLSRCGLLIANGCESHMLHPNVTDDAESLVTGFLFAGAAAVIGTHWAVWDLSAALLMEKFHQLWNGGTGLPVAAALREAARWLREDIRNGRQLVEEIVPAFLEGVTDLNTRELCRNAAAAHALRHPDTAPFAAPGHWAAFTASGAV